MARVWEKANDIQRFSDRHIGPSDHDIKTMLEKLGYASLDDLTRTALPQAIQSNKTLDLPKALPENEALDELRRVMKKNKNFRSFIGMGYYDTITPTVVQRNILENPAWYTQYTPYQPEIAQGRLEALINFQTMVCDLTGLAISNASLLDEGTAAAEAMAFSHDVVGEGHGDTYLIAAECHPQTIEVVRTRAEALGVKTKIVPTAQLSFDATSFGVLLQYPDSNGVLQDPAGLIQKAKDSGLIVTLAVDLLALCLLKSPGELGADVAVGNSQRFGVPLGYGGPHAGFFATKDEFKRRIPGRLVGLSKDANGQPAYRLALQTREQHIRRDKATSNICTAQVLLAIMASMYAVYHGPKGLQRIAERTHALTKIFASGLRSLGFKLKSENFFDTVTVVLDDKGEKDRIVAMALADEINLRHDEKGLIGISFDEKTHPSDVERLLKHFAHERSIESLTQLAEKSREALPETLKRKSEYLTHPVFNAYHSETDMMRYIRKLEGRDLSLTRSMIPLGSCTMKLNAASELMPITWPEVNGLHPFVPLDQAAGYLELFQTLERYLSACTGFDGISLQPNSGAQGEYAGLLVIRKYHQSRGDHKRTVCLIPSSAHGTNPASAVMAGMEVVVVRCDKNGNIDLEDLQEKAKEHKEKLSALMITYPSTHGVFEEEIVKICDVIHQNGGQVYMDGANLNAQIGLCLPGQYGPDVCHMNLHKTFCIPHGGGGPGVGPIGVKAHLTQFLPNHPVVTMGGKEGVGPITAAPWGSASILPISWMYVRMMGPDGLKRATQVAILNANYIAKRLDEHFPVVYRGRSGLVAHECIVDLKEVKKSADVSVDDIAKRLIDYGYHAPTVSWPVPNSMMIEPTESESLHEIDRFCDTMISIRDEIRDIERGRLSKESNPLKHAPHTISALTDAWDRPYDRAQAVFPKAWVRESKFWPFVGRIDGAFGDRNLVCTCPDISTYE